MIDTIQNVTGIEQTPVSSTPRPIPSGKAKARAAEPVGGPAPPLRSAGGLSDLVNDINDLVYELSATKVTFDVDDATGRHVVRVLNKETGDVIRQLPPEALLNLVARMRQLSGLIFNEEA
jgi:flagellar protein FlaG